MAFLFSTMTWLSYSMFSYDMAFLFSTMTWLSYSMFSYDMAFLFSTNTVTPCFMRVADAAHRLVQIWSGSQSMIELEFRNVDFRCFSPASQFEKFENLKNCFPICSSAKSCLAIAQACASFVNSLE
jgi:hypothetical protein